MNNDFDKYKKSKKVIANMIEQFYTTYISLEEADKLGIKYNNDDIVNNYIVCVANNHLPEGYYIWSLLKIDDSIITYHELYKIMESIKNEQYDKYTDYNRIYLNNCMLIIDMIKKYYSYSLIINGNLKYDIEYDEYLDVADGKIATCFHQFESAGESAWQLLNIKQPVIAMSKINEIENNVHNKLLDKAKRLKLDK